MKAPFSLNLLEGGRSSFPAALPWASVSLAGKAEQTAAEPTAQREAGAGVRAKPVLVSVSCPGGWELPPLTPQTL